MKKVVVKKIMAWSGTVFLVLVLILAVHIYIVTRPKPQDEKTRVMARIDIRDSISQTDADKITTWLYKQPGVDHVLVNAKSSKAIFTYSPLKANGDDIAKNFQNAFKLQSTRYIPTAEELKGGCPISRNSVAYRVGSYFKHIF